MSWPADLGPLMSRSNRKAKSSHLRESLPRSRDGGVREPFERLADIGLRLSALRSAAELPALLIEKAIELSGAERMLLLLDEPDGVRVAGAQLPKGEDGRAAAECDHAVARRGAPHARSQAAPWA